MIYSSGLQVQVGSLKVKRDARRRKWLSWGPKTKVLPMPLHRRQTMFLVEVGYHRRSQLFICRSGKNSVRGCCVKCKNISMVCFGLQNSRVYLKPRFTEANTYCSDCIWIFAEKAQWYGLYSSSIASRDLSIFIEM